MHTRNTLLYKVLQKVACGFTVYQAAEAVGVSRTDIEQYLNDIELRVLVVDIAILANRGKDDGNNTRSST